MTIAAAFQRFSAVILVSIAMSPSNSGCAVAGMVLTYSEVSSPGTDRPEPAAYSCIRRIRYTARSGPAFRMTASREARHSPVSSRSRSGSWSSSLLVREAVGRDGSLMAAFLKAWGWRSRDAFTAVGHGVVSSGPALQTGRKVSL